MESDLASAQHQRFRPSAARSVFRWPRAGLLGLLLISAAAFGQADSSSTEAAGHFRTLHSFSFETDRHTGGARPRGLLQAADGYFYGVSYAGGKFGGGTIYRMKPYGLVATVHSFDGADGYGPDCVLIQASDGNLYGTTNTGGAGVSQPLGTVFRRDAAGVLTVLHTFNGADGSYPRAGLVQASDGHLYGTTPSVAPWVKAQCSVSSTTERSRCGGSPHAPPAAWCRPATATSTALRSTVARSTRDGSIA